MSIQARVYQEALGIRTGDLVTTSYGTGPYEVWSILGPWFADDHGFGTIIVRSYPVVTLVVVHPGDHPHIAADFRWINNVRRDGDRWFTHSLYLRAINVPPRVPGRADPPLHAPVEDDVVVQRGSGPGIQLGLFGSGLAEAPPYPFTADVDYLAGDGCVWRCDHCGRDFNRPAPGGWAPPSCPRCGRGGRPIVVHWLAEAPPTPAHWDLPEMRP